MPKRPVMLENGNYYHVYNRGVNKRKIFLDNRDYQRALDSLLFYIHSGHRIRFSYFHRLNERLKNEYIDGLTNQLIELNSFALMPNHFHFLVYQNEANGISNCLRRFENSYTKYFNTKYKRVGPLLQGRFKAVHITNDSQLLHVSRYIHLNPLTSGVINSLDELETFPWTSYPNFLNSSQETKITNSIILGHFKNQSYKDFVSERADYQKELESIKHITFEQI